MKAIVSFLLISVPLFHPTPNGELNNEVTVNGRTFLYGEINREGLTSGQYASWFNAIYNAYQPDSEKLALCSKASLEGISVKLLMATWCGDSKRNVPAFYKIMDEMGFEEQNLKVWALDARKRGPNNEQQRYGVTRVPTIIFYRDDVEIGRFVERPKPGQRLEEVIVSILNQP